MTKLVFHLGDKKAGSTAIQTALAANNWTCESVRLLYPHGQRIHHNLLARSLTGNFSNILTEPLVRDLMDEIRAHPADVAVISAEEFEDVDPTVLKATIEAYMPGMLADARFIAYVRPHAERIPSSFAERVKLGNFAGTLAEMQAPQYKRKSLFYAPRHLKWREVFRDALTVRPLIRDQLYRQDVVADLLRFALQTEDFVLAASPDTNESLSLENLAIVRQFHLRLSGGKGKIGDFQATVGRALARQMNEGAFRNGTKVRLHKALAKLVIEQYAEDAAALDAAFFTGTPMTDALNSAVDKAVDQEQSVRIEDHFSEREQYLINTFIDQTAALIAPNPKAVVAKLRDQRQTKLAASGRAGGAGKAGRRAGAKGWDGSDDETEGFETEAETDFASDDMEDPDQADAVSAED